MDQVAGMHYRGSGGEVHGCGNHVKVFTYADYVVVRDVGKGKRIGYGLLHLNDTAPAAYCKGERHEY